MPPRDVSELVSWRFILVYLAGGPFVAGLLLAAATEHLNARVRHIFDRAGLVGFGIVLIAAIVLLRRSSGWSLLFAVPFGCVLLGVMAFRMVGARGRRGSG